MSKLHTHAAVILFMVAMAHGATVFGEQPEPKSKKNNSTQPSSIKHKISKSERIQHLKNYKRYIGQGQLFEANRELRALPVNSSEYKQARKFYEIVKKRTGNNIARKEPEKDNPNHPSNPSNPSTVGGGSYAVEGDCTCRYVRGSIPPTSCSDPRCSPVVWRK